jgi:hypothetical protein
MSRSIPNGEFDRSLVSLELIHYQGSGRELRSRRLEVKSDECREPVADSQTDLMKDLEGIKMLGKARTQMYGDRGNTIRPGFIMCVPAADRNSRPFVLVSCNRRILPYI